MTTPAAPPRAALLLAVLGALTFGLLCGWRLGGPGFYYDECPWVPAIFTCLGQPAQLFDALQIGDVTWQAMTYCSAAKSWLFALLMRLGLPFTLETWRWFGVAQVAVPLFAFLYALARRVGPGAALLALALFLTDLTVLLTTRVDYGNTAMALGLRLFVLALWIEQPAPPPRTLFLMGLLLGFGVFEKLNNVVVVPVLALAAWGSGRRGWAAALAGGAVGALPLLIVNVASWITQDRLISLADAHDDVPWRPLWVIGHYLSLAQGDFVRGWFFARSAPWLARLVEAVLVGGVGLLLLAARPAPVRRMAAAWWLILLALLLLPRRTEAHHWIAGTPFLYAALALAWPLRPRARPALVAAWVVVLLLRGPALADTFRTVRDARYYERFDPSHTRAVYALAARTNALVIASTWGIGAQLVGQTGGRPGAVVEAFRDPEALARLLRNPPHEVIYLVDVPRVRSIYRDETARVEQIIERQPGWWEKRPEPDLRDLSAVRIRKFVRRTPPRTDD